MDEKTFPIYLLLNWKTGEVILRKRAPEKQAGYWVGIKLNITLRIPDTEHEVTLAIEVPQTKVAEIVLEAIGEGDKHE